MVVPLWLAFLNTLLAVFNLLPGFPLDGGRILHAFLWARSGDRVRASATAARTGRALGVVLIAAGLLEFFAVATLGGLWLVFVGWFLVGAARSEEMQSRLSGLRVRDVMSPDPIAVPSWLTVETLLHDYVLSHRVSCFPLRDVQGNLVGVVSLRRLGAVPRQLRAITRVGEIATPMDRVARAAPDDPVLEMLGKMQASDDGRVLVFDGDRLAGIVSPSDVARAMQLAALDATGR